MQASGIIKNFYSDSEVYFRIFFQIRKYTSGFRGSPVLQYGICDKKKPVLDRLSCVVIFPSLRVKSVICEAMNIMILKPEQPISTFTKQNQLYRICDIITNRYAAAIQEVLTHCMKDNVFKAPVAMIPWFSDILGVSQRTVGDAFAYLDTSLFLIQRKTKSCVINPLLANKCEILTGQLQKIIVEPYGYDDKYDLIKKVSDMRNYNQSLSPKAHVLDKMAMQFAVDCLASERIRRLEDKVDRLGKSVDYLMSRVSNEDAEKARSMFRVIEGDLQ